MMSPEKIFSAVLACTVLLSPLAAGAQQQIQTPNGTLEVLGLKRWTVQMIEDSAAKYAPGQDLATHACAAVLRLKLGFADASVMAFPVGPHTDSLLYIVTVVEPQDSALIRYRDTPVDSLPTPGEWRSAVQVFTEHNLAFQRAVQTPGFLRADTLDPGVAARYAEALPVRSLVRAHRDTADYTGALHTLANDGSWINRMVAVLLLQNFPARDSTWWALADALRDRDGFVSGTAGMVLERMAPRRVDWAPMVSELRALLDGTDLFAHNTIMHVLASTEVAPDLAAALLHEGGALVLAKLGSSDPVGRVAAHDLLVQLAGRDLGFAVRAWKEWIDRL
jgi:hypothetical protein